MLELLKAQRPPPASRIVPVTYDAPGDVSHRMASAISGAFLQHSAAYGQLAETHFLTDQHGSWNGLNEPTKSSDHFDPEDQPLTRNEIKHLSCLPTNVL